MHIDLQSEVLNFKNKFKKIYDYIIIGSGPAATVILNNLTKKNKKILVIERGSFQKKFGEKLVSNNIKIKKESRIFGIGGTSNSWSQIYSLLSKNEMCNNKNFNIWPISYEDLSYWCNKVGPQYNFDIKNLDDIKIFKDNFYSRKFIESKNPERFSKYYHKKNFDLITNCKIQTIDESNNQNLVYFSLRKKIYTINSRKIIICAGAIESCSLIINSIKEKKLKKIKNKKFIGRYFMDHPKCYVGELKYPKKKIIDEFKLKFRKKYNTYRGLSIYKKNQKTINTYVRFEEKRNFLGIYKKTLVKIFFEMEPKFKNRIYIKKNITNIDLSLSKKEIKQSKELLEKIKKFFSYKPKLEKIDFKIYDLVDASHHIGGLVYPKIVDRNLKIKGLKNTYCCSSAVFPTSGSVNPTLIICGLAERLSKLLT